VVAACARLDADVLVIEENWAPDGEASLAGRIAGELGYELVEAELSRAGVLEEDPQLGSPGAPNGGRSPARWAPPPYRRRGVPRALLLEGARRRHRSASPSGSPRAGHLRVRRRGSWGLAVLSRLPIRRSEVIDLRRLPRDAAQRRAIAVELDGITVVGVHLAHLTHGSVLQMRQLAAELGRREGPLVLAGDMNSWTLPLLPLLPGWRKAVHGRTWPSAAPHSQIDHILVKGPVEVLSGEVLAPAGSDHRPVRARLALVDRRGADRAVAREPSGLQAAETPRS
jgi:endonuclease/exonuclease/phosphatase family metal-dependent hydrolase